MTEKVRKLKSLIDASERILITSHISPDADAISSLLLCGTAIKANFANKKVVMNAEELTDGLDFLNSYGSIQVQPLVTALKQTKPQLVIIVDAMNLGRCTRGDVDEVRETVKELGASIVIIDHHEPVEIETGAVYINQSSPAAVQDVYQVFFEQLEYRKPDGYAETAMTGILSDTARFQYDNPRHRETFRITSDLLDAGASIELLENRARRYTRDEITVLGELSFNIEVGEGFSYSYVSDNFTRKWLEAGKTADEFKRACEVFVSGFIRNIGNNKWGFIVYPDLSGGEGRYSVSLRSLGAARDVAAIARKLGGGGHKPAAGAKFTADSVGDAVNKVLAAI